MPLKSDRTRRKIIATVLEAMDQGTFDLITTREIAERAGVKQGWICRGLMPLL